MPHSVSPESSPSTSQEDSVLPDAPSPDLVEEEEQVAENKESLTKDISSLDGAVKLESKPDVKLEDLFDDDDSDDDEFPTSSAVGGKVESSPPAEPVYGIVWPANLLVID